MPKKSHRNSSYNKKGGNTGGKRGLASLGKQNKDKSKNKKKKVIMMRPDKAIREQPFEYVVLAASELALQDPLQEVQQRKEIDATPTHVRLDQEATAEAAEETASVPKTFDPKQIVLLSFAVLHAPSGTVCGRMQSLVKPPPTAEPLSQFCLNTLGFQLQSEIDSAPALVDVMRRAEQWVLDVIAGKVEDPDAVFDLQHHSSSDDDEDTDDDDEEHDDEEEPGNKKNDGDDGDDDDDDGDDKNKSTAAATTNENAGAAAAAGTHKIILAADGVSSIAAIFQGNQQFMRPAAEDADDKKFSKDFSFLNLLGGEIFTRWIDIRECYHRYFRVTKVRLNFNEQLREIGLAFKGSRRNPADKVLNMATLMVAMMKKGCVFGFSLQCRTQHEQHKVVAQHGQAGTVAIGESSVAAAYLAGGVSGTAEGGKLAAQKPHKHHHHEKVDPSNFMANTADVSQLRDDGGSGSPLRRRVCRGGEATTTVSSLVFGAVLNQVFLRWLAMLVLLVGICWNVWNRKGSAALNGGEEVVTVE